jgi:hypothetical protein
MAGLNLFPDTVWQSVFALINRQEPVKKQINFRVCTIGTPQLPVFAGTRRRKITKRSGGGLWWRTYGWQQEARVGKNGRGARRGNFMVQGTCWRTLAAADEIVTVVTCQTHGAGNAGGGLDMVRLVTDQRELAAQQQNGQQQQIARGISATVIDVE